MTDNPPPIRRARERSLLELAPTQCESGGRFHGGPNCSLRVPSHLPPQKVLHWLMESALASLDTEFSKELVRGLIELGADPLRLTAANRLTGTSFEKQRRLSRTTESGHTGRPEQLAVELISPLGGVLLAMNSSALYVLSSVMSDSDRPYDPAATVARLKAPPTAPQDHDAWTLLARLRLWDQLPKLDVAFSTGWMPKDALSANGTRERLLGAALVVLLADRPVSLIHYEHIVLRAATEFLRRGASPDQDALQGAGVDPGLLAWIVATADILTDQESVQLVSRLVDLELPVDPQKLCGAPALHAAAEKSKPLTVVQLLEAGAEPLRKNAAGQTLEQLVLERRDDAVLRVMRAWAAKRLALEVVNGMRSFCTPDRT